jgi:hypothetical protein
MDDDTPEVLITEEQRSRLRCSLQDNLQLLLFHREVSVPLLPYLQQHASLFWHRKGPMLTTLPSPCCVQRQGYESQEVAAEVAAHIASTIEAKAYLFAVRCNC